MAKFIQLTRVTCLEDKRIWVNVDTISTIWKNGISFIGDGDVPPLDVKESPEEILKLIKGE
ncbi:MAG: hypothetical protein J5601_04495 [Elusimicrobiaceae bacterium]|nr:hypothetical protein [Elusimicrobiaceae bacterium]